MEILFFSKLLTEVLIATYNSMQDGLHSNTSVLYIFWGAEGFHMYPFRQKERKNDWKNMSEHLTAIFIHFRVILNMDLLSIW